MRLGAAPPTVPLAGSPLLETSNRMPKRAPLVSGQFYLIYNRCAFDDPRGQNGEEDALGNLGRAFINFDGCLTIRWHGPGDARRIISEVVCKALGK